MKPPPMLVMKDIHIVLDADEVESLLFRGSDTPQIKDDIRTAVNMAEDLIRPVAVCAWVDVLSVRPNSVVVSGSAGSGPVTLRMGPLADLMEEAKQALAGVVSIGAELDEQCRRLTHSGEPLASYLLDTVGVVALGKVGETIHRLAETEAERRNWGVGPSLAPGSLDGWPIEDQVKLCSLLSLDQIGVRLNDSGVMVPFKSASALIGSGPGYSSRSVGSTCRFCTHAQTCRHRWDS